MANYPSYNILLDSTREEESGVEDDFSEAGTQHSRLFHSQPYYRFRLRHALTLAQWKALKVLYDAGRRDLFTLTYLAESPQVTYSVKFTAPPQIVQNLGLDNFIVESPLRGYAN